MKNKKRNLFIYMTIIVVAAFSYAIINYRSLFILDGDNFEQGYLFLLGGLSKLKDGSFSSYDWTSGFGNDFLCYSFYSSPLFFMFSLLPKFLIKYFFLYYQLLKIVLLFIANYYWFSKITNNFRSILIGSFVITFSGWTFRYLSLMNYIGACIFFPLILGATENYLQKKQKVLLTMLVFLLTIHNYYFMYMLVPFLCLYILFRYIWMNKLLELKPIVFIEIKYIGIIFLGLLLAAFSLLPNAYIVFSMPRFADNATSLLTHLNFNEVYRLFSSIYTPVMNIFSYNPFISSWDGINIGWNGGGSLYSLIIFPFLIPLLFAIKDKRKKKILLTSFLLLFIFLYFKSFYILFQRTLESRWFYMFTFLAAFALTYINEEIEKENITRKQITYSLISIIACIFMVFVCSYIFKFNDLSSIKNILKTLIPVYLCIILYYIYYMKYKSLSLVLIAILSFEAIISGYLYCKSNTPLEEVFFKTEFLLEDVIKVIKENDSSFYRIVLDKESMPDYYKKANIPFAYDFPGVSMYTSTYEGNLSNYLRRINSGLWIYDTLFGRSEMYDQLSAKYYITYGENSSQSIPLDYEYLFDKNGFNVYVNNYSIGLGYALPSYSEEKMPSSYLEQDQIMQNFIISSDGENSNWTNSLKFLGKLTSDSYRELWLDIPIHDGILYFENFGIPCLTIELWNEDILIKKVTVEQFDYIDLIINDTEYVNKIVVIGEDIYDTNLFMNVFFKSHESLRREKENRKLLENIQYSKNKLTCSIETIDESLIYTSIPYSKGWQVYVNGMKVNTQKVNDGFLGFDIPGGDSKIKLEYKTPLKIPGTLISLITFTFIILFWINKYKQKIFKTNKT